MLSGHLVAIDPSSADPSEDVTRLIPVAEHTFRMETSDGYGSQGELFVFELDDDGRVTRAKIGVNYTYPVEAW